MRRGVVSAIAGSVNPMAEALKLRTFKFALAIVRFCRLLRETWEGRELSDQLFRAGTRIGANYRAACRARSHPDFVNKIGHVVEEADEAVYWLELIHENGFCKAPGLDALRREAAELSAIFNQSQLTAKSNSPWRRPSPGPARPPGGPKPSPKSPISR